MFAEEGLEARACGRSPPGPATPGGAVFPFRFQGGVYASAAIAGRAGDAVSAAVATARGAKQRLHAAGISFFRYYADNPRDLDLGFYLFRRHEASRFAMTATAR